MKQKNYSVTSMWDTRAMNKKTKLSRIMLSVIIDSKQFRITLNLKSTKEEYNKAISASRTVSEEAKEVRKDLHDYLQKAETILDRLDNPNKETFTRLFKSESDLFSSNKTEISTFFQFKISILIGEEKFSSAEIYRVSLISLYKYKPTGVIHFEEINEKWLKGYVSWMLAQGNSITTAYIYLRNLRVIFNEVIKDGIISQKHYPFKNFSMSSSIKSKNVLYPAQLKQLL